MRAKLQADFEALDAAGFESLDDISEEHYIASSSYRSVFNKHQEVQIEGSIWVYYNEDFAIEITDGSLDTRNDLRNYRSVSPDEVPVLVLSLPNIELHPLGSKLRDSQKGIDVGGAKSLKNNCNSGFRLQNLNFVPTECNPLIREVQINSGVQFTDCGQFIYHNQPVTYTINWGDNTADQVVGRVNGEPFIEDHAYANSGTYTITVEE